jgi:hypothetical protein
MDESKEPTAIQREGARDMFGMYNALRMEGFTETQACVIIGTMLGTAGRA